MGWEPPERRKTLGWKRGRCLVRRAGPGAQLSRSRWAGPGEEMDPKPGQRGGVAGRLELRGCCEAPPPPHPRPSPSREGRKPRQGERGRGRVRKREEAAALECSFRGPADAGSEDIAPHSSSSVRQAVPSRHVSEQASRRGPAAGARGQWDLQVSAQGIGPEPSRVGSGAQERRGRGSRLSSGILGKAPFRRSRPPRLRRTGCAPAEICGLAPPLMRPAVGGDHTQPLVVWHLWA